MAEHQPVLGEQRLGLGAAQAGAEGRRRRDRVEREQAAHPAEVEGDHPGEAVAVGREAAGHRGATAEGDDHDPVLLGVVEHRLHVVVIGGTDDDVGRVAQVAGPLAEQVGRRLAAGALAAYAVVEHHVLLADGPRAGRSAARPRGAVAGTATSAAAGVSESWKTSADEVAHAVRERTGVGRVAPPRRRHLGLEQVVA